nr:choice-of-anchor B family protein [Saprospiraceae bacterium]
MIFSIKKIQAALIALVWVSSVSVYGQENFNMEFKSNFDYGPMVSDVWGFVASDSTEYAVVGVVDGTSIVSLGDPENPDEVAFIPGGNSTWRDIVSWDEYIYIVADAGGTTDGILIVDMTDAPNNIEWKFINPQITINGVTETLNRCHNIWMDEKGYAYLSGCNMNSGGVLIMDMEADPWNPEYLGASAAVYSHDNYTWEGTMYSAEIYKGAFAIYDVSDPADVVLINDQTTSSDFTHNCWLSDDGNYLFTTDEKANAYVDAYDVSDPYDIKFLSSFRPMTNEGEGVIPHNVHYHDGYLVVSWYTDGVIVIDAHRPENMVKVGQYDTYSGGHGGFSGCWGAYPYLPSGLVLASDRQTGLYVLEPTYVRASYLEGIVTSASDGSNINNVEIEILTDFPNGTHTGPDGVYKTGLPETGLYEVSFSHPDYQDTIIEVDFISGEVVDLDVEMEPNPCTPPLVQASDFTVLQNGSTQMEIGWQRGTGDQVMVIARENGLVNTFPEEGENYSANSTFGAGDEIGQGNFVVYSGTGSSTLVLGLEPQTNYGFAILEFDEDIPCYLLPPEEGLEMTSPLESNLSIVKTTMENSAYPGDTVTFTLEINNSGPDQATGVLVIDSLPGELIYHSSDPSGTHSNGVVEWNLGNVNINQAVTLTLEVIIDEDADEGSAINYAEVSGDNSDPDPSDNSDTEEIEILCDPDHICQSDVVVYAEAGSCEAQAFFDQEGCDYESGDFFSLGVTVLDCDFINSCGENDSCSFTVTVLDTLAPVITTCPTTRTVIGCEPNDIFGPDYSDTTKNSSYSVFSDSLNQGVATDNCEIGEVTYIDSEGQNCPFEIIRTWTVMDESGNEVSCEQTLVVDPPVLSLECPSGLIYNSCLSQTDVDIAFFDWLNDADVGGGCNTALHHDNTEPPSHCGGIVTVVFTLTDDCGQELSCSSSFEVPEGPDLELECPAPSVVETPASDCFYLHTGSDWDPEITESCGDTEASYQITGALNLTGTGTLDGVEFPVGISTVLWTVTDLCSEQVCGFEVEVLDSTSPLVNCPADTAVVVPVGVDSVYLELEQATASDNCGVMSITNNYNSGGANASDHYPLDTTWVVFTAVDSAGNESECTTQMVVSWDVGSGEFAIGGTVESIYGGKMKDVKLSITGDLTDSVFTDSLGKYSIVVDEGSDLTITPTLEEGWLPGLSTFDLVLIQKHILHLERLDSPYLIIAADANDDGKVNTMDLILLQNIILGNLLEIAGNTPWRFIPQEYVFDDPEDPLVENWPESKDYTDHNENLSGENWLGIKVGDINGSIENNPDRVVYSQLYLTAEVSSPNQDEQRVAIRSTDECSIFGYQMEWKYQPEYMDLVEIDTRNSNLNSLSEVYFSIDKDNGIIRALWYEASPTDLKPGEELFSLVFEKRYSESNIEYHLKLMNRGDLWYSEAYLSDKKPALFIVDWEITDAKPEFVLYQNTPNPFSTQTVIPFKLPGEMIVTLEIMDSGGRMWYHSEFQGRAGMNEMFIQEPMPEGVLFYRITAGDWSAVKKMVSSE